MLAESVAARKRVPKVLVQLGCSDDKLEPCPPPPAEHRTWRALCSVEAGDARGEDVRVQDSGAHAERAAAGLRLAHSARMSERTSSRTATSRSRLLVEAAQARQVLSRDDGGDRDAALLHEHSRLLGGRPC